MNEKKSILKYEIISAVFVIILGIILHFTFKWSGNNPLVGAFSPVNESVWEHLKLLFFPVLLSTFIVYLYKGKFVPDYLCAKVRGIILSLIFIVVFYYTYTGIIGTNYAVLDVGSFLIAVVLAHYSSYKKMNTTKSCSNLISISVLLILCLVFIAFTFFPPHIGLFKDPISGTFGIIDF